MEQKAREARRTEQAAAAPALYNIRRRALDLVSHMTRRAGVSSLTTLRRFGWAAAFLATLAGAARADDSNAGLLGLVHRLSLRGDNAALERLLVGSATGGVVEPAMRAHVLTALGRFDDAGNEFRRALQSAPGDASVLFGLADLEARRGKPDAALTALSDLWRGNAAPPLKAEAVRRQLALVAAADTWDSVDWGAALGSIGDPDLAWRLLDALLESSDSAGALFRVERATSRTLGGEALAIGPALVLASIALRVGDFARADASVEDLLRGAGRDEASAFALRGEVALSEGRGSEAMRAFSQARTLMPGWDRMLERRARAARAAGDAAAAEQDLRALAGQPLDLGTHDAVCADLIKVELERGQWADVARIYLDGVTGRGPERRSASLESVVTQVPNPTAARSALRGIVVPSEQSGELHRLLAELAARTGDQAGAIRELEVAHDIAPADPEILERLAQLERQSGKLDRAAAHYQAWAEREPRRGAPLTGLVATLRQEGQSNEALEAGLAPSREAPSDAAAWALSSTVLSLAGFTREGCDAARRAHELAPDRASYAFDLAGCLGDLDQGKESIALFEALLERGSNGVPWQRPRVLERLRAGYASQAKGTSLGARVLEIAGRATTVDAAGLLLDAAETLVAAGDVASAATFLDRVVTHDPSDRRWPAAALRLADLEAGRGRGAQAQQLWHTITARADLAPQWGVSASLAEGESLLPGAPAKALEEWDQCATRHATAAPGARCRLRRARAFADAGRRAEASADLVNLLSNPARDVETTRAALSLLHDVSSAAAKGAR